MIQRHTRRTCVDCKRWMIETPTDNTPLKRRQPPFADRCVECAIPQDTLVQELSYHLKIPCFDVYRIFAEGQAFEAAKRKAVGS